MAAVRPWRPSWRRSSSSSLTVSRRRARTGSCSGLGAVALLELRDCAVSARTTLLCDGGGVRLQLVRGRVACVVGRRGAAPHGRGARSGYWKSIDTPAVLASPRNVIGSRLAISSLRAVRRAGSRPTYCAAAARRLSGFPRGISGSAVAQGWLAARALVPAPRTAWPGFSARAAVGEHGDDLLQRALLGQALLEPHVRAGHLLARSWRGTLLALRDQLVELASCCSCSGR